MGYMRHHAIIVTCGTEESAQEARAKACEIFVSSALFHAALVSEIVPSMTNGYYTFVVAPDGSKEGWPASDMGDEQRAAFTRWLEEWAGSDWALVQYGDENGDDHVVAAG